MEFINIKGQYRELQKEIESRIAEVFRHGRFIMGPEVQELEAHLASYVGRQYCISCGNGTDALQLIYMAYGIGPGDAIFCPDVTFIASVEPACMLGATPVFCDITPDTYNLCPQSLERQIKAVQAEGRLRPKAVVAVDFLGLPADYEALSSICRKYGLLYIEDAAQSMGAKIENRLCCSFGDAAATSFFPAKPFGCYGDGGAVFTDNKEKAELLSSLRVHGKGKGGKYDNVRVGINSRLDTLQAAVLLAKLEALEREMEIRQEKAAIYDQAFAGKLTIPFIPQGMRSAYAQYALLAKNKDQRDLVLAKLSAMQIPHMVYYPTPQHMLPVFQRAPHYGEAFPNAVSYCERTFSLPFSPYLSQADQNQVIDAVLEVFYG